MKDRTKKRTRRALIALLALALLLPLFAAFEAHIVNVKAHIENALFVEPKEMDFGVVFPQEELVSEEPIRVGLSESFMQQDRVTDVFYKLVQKRKPKTPSDKLDVIFAFDLTGSMSGALVDAQDKATDMMAALKLVGPDVRFGVMSHVDYPHYYEDYYGYSATYGDSDYGDYAYNLDHALDSDTVAVEATIDALETYYGGDGPQNYTRIMYESWADGAVGWRPGAQQVVIMFTDNVPHDNNLEEGISGGAWSTGGDPGRDEVAMTADDLDLQTELANLAWLGKKVYTVHYGGYVDYWKYWTGITGGDAVSATGAGDIVTAIEDLFFYEDLRPYLDKVSLEDEGDVEDFAVLDKSVGDIEDRWSVQFHVPCIAGAVGQDYEGPIAPREADYGADIWVEVFGLSYADGTTWPRDIP